MKTNEQSTMVYTAVLVLPRGTFESMKKYTGTASNSNDKATTRAVDCDSRRAVGPTKTIRGVFLI